MKISQTTKSLIILTIAHVAVIILIYSTFLQIPVFPGEKLMWGSIVEQFTTWIPVAIAYIYLIKTVTNRSLKKQSILKTKKLTFIGLFLFFTAFFSTGAHAVASIIEDALIKEANPQLFSLVFILDEYIGHLFVPLLSIALFFLVIYELETKYQTIKIGEKILLIFLGFFNGAVWAIGGTEGGSMYILTAPIMLIQIWWLMRAVKAKKIKLANYPYAYYYLISSLVMLTLTAIWVFSNGILAQPSDLGIQLLTF